MFGYRRKSFRTAHALLSELREHPERLADLALLQNLLIDEIIIAETKIQNLKKNPHTKHPTKTPEYIQKRLTGSRFTNFVWRCFGDAIVL
jgi:hypothetical protein